jgi:integrase
MAQGKLERVEKHPGVYRRHVKDCPRQGRCQCAYVLVYNGRAETFRTLAEADEGKRLAQRQARLAKAHASGHHRGVPEAECPECERERATRESAGGTFEAFAAAWYAEHEHEWEQRTRTDYSWRLNSHLLPWFGARRPSEIDVDFVDRYKAHKLAESARLQKEWDAWHASRGEKPKARPLGPRTINMTLILLSAILDAAEERKLIERNPAAGKRRRVKERKPKRTQLDTATAIEALLFAAGELDAEAQEHPQSKVRLLPRRAIVATLLLSGPRIGELVDDRWADVDLANDRIQYDSKTPAGCRWVRLLPALHDELATLKAQRDPSPDDYVFGTARGGKQSESNIRNRVLSKAVERANEQLARAREAPLPHLTPHGCRRTFASIRYALGASPAEVMAELGHTNPSLALAVYAQAMRMSEKEKARLRALVEGTLGSLGSRWDQDDGRESPQIATIESAEANGRKAAGSRRKVGQP